MCLVLLFLLLGGGGGGGRRRRSSSIFTVQGLILLVVFREIQVLVIMVIKILGIFIITSRRSIVFSLLEEEGGRSDNTWVVQRGGRGRTLRVDRLLACV